MREFAAALICVAICIAMLFGVVTGGYYVYAYFAPKPAGRGRARYVPASLVAAVRARLVRGEQVATLLAEISAINAELLARRELR